LTPVLRIEDAALVVVGSGLAGLTVALEAGAAGRSGPVLLLTKTAALAGGNSPAALGGIAAAVGPGDAAEAHAADTVAAGAGLSDPAMAALLAREGAERMHQLLALGLPFDRAPDGAPALGREAAHGAARILHAGGDATGRVLVAALAQRLAACPGVCVATETFVHQLVLHQGRVWGVLACDRQGWVWYRAPAVVLATGGIGAAFRHTTNPLEATGDGLALAARAGARLADLEFVQFHPTALVVEGGLGRPAPLLTEALRGAGARLVDGAGRSLMADEHPACDLAPRDVVARALGRRLAAGERVWLDLRPALAGQAEAFPSAVAACTAASYDPLCAPVPVAPAAHYHMGGIATDADGRTSLPGLWACGEVACTGVHGANRLASNSLLEGLVFGLRVVRDLERPLDAAVTIRPPLPVPPVPAVPGPAAAAELAALLAEARGLLADQVGLVRERSGLMLARRRLARLADRWAALPAAPAAGAVSLEAVRRWGEVGNQLLVGRLIAEAAWQRQESRGAHCRADFPESLPQARHSSLTLASLNPAPSAASSVVAGAPVAAGENACLTR